MSSPWSNQLVSLVIISEPPGQFAGLFLYSPTIGPGNLVAWAANQNGTDPFGNQYFAGIGSRGSNMVSLLQAGFLYLGLLADFLGSNTPGNLFSQGGVTRVNSGLQGVSDLQAALFVQSQVASGHAGGVIQTVAARTTFGINQQFTWDDGSIWWVNAKGIFMYSGTPAAGNLIASLVPGVNPVVDPFGNSAGQGLTIGIPGFNNPQIEIAGNLTGGFVCIFNPNNGNFSGGSFQLNITTFCQFVLLGPANQGALGHADSVNIQLNSSDGSSSANLELQYQDSGGTGHNYLTEDFRGITIGAAKAITGTQPGTGIAANNVAVSEIWHAASLQNSWAGSGANVNGLRYRYIPKGPAGSVEIQAEITNSVNTGNIVIATLPAGYIPTIGINEIAGINDPTYTHPPPWINVLTNGNIECIDYPAVNQVIFFHMEVPLD